MASLNSCSFIGNVGKIETRFMTNGEAVTNFSLAVNESYKDKQGEKVDKTEWVNCTAYRKLAEIMQEYVKVGSPLYISGKMSTRKLVDKETGKDRYTTEIIVNEMQMLGSKPADDGAPRETSKPAQPDVNAQPGKQPVHKPSSFDNFDDDQITF